MKIYPLIRLTTLIAIALIFGNSTSLFAQSPQQKTFKRIIEEKIRHAPMDPNRMGRVTPNASRMQDEQKLTTENSLSVSEGESFIAINPTDSNNLVLSFMSNSPVGGLVLPIYYTLDGGDSWMLSEFDTPTFYSQDTSLFVAGGGDPVFAFDADGKLYFSWIYAGIDITNPFDLYMRMYWVWSDDKGKTFQALNSPHHLIGQGAFIDLLTNPSVGSGFGDGIFDRQWMAIDQSGGPFHNSLYAAMLFAPSDSTKLAGSGIVCKYKRAGDPTFRAFHAPVSASTHLSTQFTNIVVDGMGNVHVSFVNMDTVGDAAAVYHAVSADGGASFRAPVKVADLRYDVNQQGTGAIHDRENPSPTMAVDPVSGTVYLAWSSFEVNAFPSGTHVQGFMSRSLDGGASWSPAIELSDLISPGIILHGLMPTVAANGQGGVSVSWFALDTAQVEGQYYIVESLDEGMTFGVPTVVSQATTRFSDYSGGEFFGDYNNAVKTNCYTYSVWSDGRNGSGAKAYVGRTAYCDPAASIFEVTPLSADIRIGTLYPQPADDQVFIPLTLKKNTSLTVSLRTLNGQKITKLYEGNLTAGTHKVEVFLAEKIAAGVYLLYLETEFGYATRKVLKK